MILDKCSYISAIEEILNDNSKFSKLDIPVGKEINHIVNLEKRITSALKLLKDKEIIDKPTCKSIKPIGSRPGILYGSGKIHKETRNGLPPFRPILSAIDTPTYRLAKFLLKFLTPSTANEYTVYTPNWSEEVFVIKKVKTTVPWTYVINDLNGEEINGTFYKKELQKANQEEFRIEKVIKRKGDKIYVKWKGYDDSFNNWIDIKDLIK